MVDPIRRTFLAIGALFGTCFAIVLPPMQAPDEFAHLDRAYGIAEGTCVAAELTPIPVSVGQLAFAFPPKLESQRRIGYNDVGEFLHMPLDDSRRDNVKNEAANMYSCFPYIPGAVGIEAGRLFHAPPGMILYLTRFANLLAYLAAVYFALRLLPDFQLPLMCLALMPMALNQAASASWDGVAYATAFLLAAYILKLAWDPSIDTLQPRHYATLGGLIVAASLCKTDVWLSPLLILVPASRFKGMPRKCAVLIGVLALAMLTIGGWNYLNRANVARWIAHVNDWRQIDFPGNAAFLYQHPVLVFDAAMRTTAARWDDFTGQIIGRLGWLAVKLPEWAVWLYVALLAFVALTGTALARLKWPHRVVCLGIVALATASIYIGMFCAEVPVDYRNGILHDVGHIPGVQGRYFIPFVFPLMLALANRRLRLHRKWLLAGAAAVVVTVNAMALENIESTFYLSGPAGNYYENKMVKAIGATGTDAKVYWIHAGKRQWVKHSSWITSHGFHWPDDVVPISASQLSTIPEAPPIEDEK
jgi:hypothetical protein